MSTLPRVTVAMTAGALPDRPAIVGEGGMEADWRDLVDELDRWDAAGRIAALWWRDDDAVAATPQLEALLRVAGDIPLGLAVIPALARPELAEALAERPQIAVLQHGWQHRNRAGCARKSEYPADLPLARVAAELAAGKTRLAALFGARALPVLVPPWNRLAAPFLALLPQIGIACLSGMSSVRAAALPPGLVAIDVHVDLVAWREDRRFIGEAAALGAMTTHLQAARRGAGRVQWPIGILTHHLVTDAPTTAFIERLVAITKTHPAARWTPVGELLQ